MEESRAPPEKKKPHPERAPENTTTFASFWQSDEKNKKTLKYIVEIKGYSAWDRGRQFLIEENEINIGDQLLIKGVTTGEQKIELTEMLVNGQPSEKAFAGSTCTFKLPFRIRLSDKLYKIIE
jgi:hypothetical protein